MSARRVWDELMGQRWSLLETWKAEGKPESDHLEFKEGASNDGEPRSADRTNYARTLSAFANVAGGVLIFGASTARKEKVDCLKRLKPIAKVNTYAERLRNYLQDITTPTIPGVRIEPIVPSPASDSGVVAVYVPEGDGGPYRTAGSCDADVKDRYYMRTATASVVIPHQILGAMFGRRAAPRLRLYLARESLRDWILVIENMGGGSAHFPYVRLLVRGIEEGSTLKPRFEVLPPWERRYPVPAGAVLTGAAALPLGHLIYTHEAHRVARLDFLASTFIVEARINADGAAPVLVECVVDPIEVGTKARLWSEDASTG